MTNYNLRLTTYREICATEKDGVLSNFPLLSSNDSYRLQNQYLLQRSLVVLDFHEHARKTRADVLYTPNLGGLSFFYLNEHGVRCVLRGTGGAHHCVSSDVLTPYESECFDFVEEHFAPPRIHCRTLQKYISHDHQGSVNYIAVQKDTPTHFMTYAGASCNHLNELKICTVDPIYNRQSLFFQHAQKLDPSRVIYGTFIVNITLNHEEALNKEYVHVDLLSSLALLNRNVTVYNEQKLMPLPRFPLFFRTDYHTHLLYRIRHGPEPLHMPIHINIR
ncbi:HLHm7 [Acrasis kona]|uniref:HLHm7 n=1 Tax=Acrasis kona TaxID=1008807 RepID=A0AAW2YZ18_9EUKA